MSNTVIKVENLSKQYRLGQVGTGTLSHDINRLWHKVRGKEDPYLKIGESNDRTIKGSSDYVWALKDINFNVEQGEVLGIIGRNGAGKSTLLKILSRTTTPTKGNIKIKGRVASLLEVGTGFHPELSGRDNIFLNGAILGMTKKEIQRKFDEIVDFAGVERYIDTPVKRYSSGMYVRLAFAVAAHLEPEILIVDEVLAVGDAEFQKKCLGKMKDVSINEGRTVLFVSHNMPTITSLCDRTILIENGRIKIDGQTSVAVSTYYNSSRAIPTHVDYSILNRKPGDEFVQLLQARLLKGDQLLNSPELMIDEEVVIEMKYKILKSDKRIFQYPNFHVYDSAGICVFVTAPATTWEHKENVYIARCTIPANLLNQGVYYIGIAVSSFGQGVKVHFFEQNALSLNVNDPLYDIPTRLQLDGELAFSGEIPGVIRPLLNWEIIPET